MASSLVSVLDWRLSNYYRLEPWLGTLCCVLGEDPLHPQCHLYLSLEISPEKILTSTSC